MNLFENVEFNSIQFIGPIIIFVITLIIPPLIIKIFFAKFLTEKLYKFLIGAALFLGLYIWAIPMNLGFYEFFK